MRTFILVCLALTAVVRADDAPIADAAFPLQARRILFLGDSITFAGEYIVEIDAALRLAGVEPRPEIINIGLPSETASGLSEAGHPFPRPCVHTRLASALEKVQPDVVVICYGMNDGIYAPPSVERFAAYRDGMTRLIAAVHEAGAKVILLTPPPFDPLPVRARLEGGTEGEFGYQSMHAGYDEVLAGYAAWVLEQRKLVAMVVDIRSPMLEATTEGRESQPDFTVIPDGIHPNLAGHHLMAAAILSAWRIDPPADIDDALRQLITKRQSLLRDAWLTHVGHERPGMTAGLDLDAANEQSAALEREITARLDELRESSAQR